jgi:uncharacterized protein YndB with AHSA1/START domain
MSDRSDANGETVRIERTFNAPRARVFEAWTSEEVLRRWWHAEHNWETPSAVVDLVVGGAIRIVMRDPATDASYGGGGQFTVIEPPRRLAYTWTWDDAPGTVQLIEVEFTDLGDRTAVVFTNSGIPPEAKDEHREGWQNSFDNLDRALSR